MQPPSHPAFADLDAFRAGLEPMAASGKLGMLLIQFPPAFHRTPESEAYLAALLSAFKDYPLAVELRHRSWSDRAAETRALLQQHGATWVQIDEPKFRFSIRQNYLPNVQGFYYMRLHGRNAAKWWRHDKSEDRYDYLYSNDELKEFSETADAARRPEISTPTTAPQASSAASNLVLGIMGVLLLTPEHTEQWLLVKSHYERCDQTTYRGVYRTVARTPIPCLMSLGGTLA